MSQYRYCSQDFLCLAFTMLIACMTNACAPSLMVDEPYGVNASRIGYIPARMALGSCLTWPDRSTRLARVPLTNTAPADVQQLCQDFDAYVAAGFDNQPFMKGLSVKFTERLYTQAGLNPPIPQAIAEQWRGNSSDCQQCLTTPSFYRQSIMKRRDWLFWLGQVSQATKGADALLIPIVVFNTVERIDDRGLITAERAAGIALLLIDTSTGELIWSGGRESSINQKAYANTPAAKTLTAPPQAELNRRLLTDALWLGFPGRQIYK